MDRMRESLFAILGDLTGSSFLDLFSGSGCVAIEAASRGAEPIDLVEADKGKRETIEKNLSFVKETHHLYMMDAYRYIASCLKTYDIIYADPPFKLEGKVQLLEKIAASDILKDEGLFIIHYPAEEDKFWPKEIGGLVLTDERKYGRSHLKFYKKGKNI